MSDSAVKAEGIGKRYRIRHQRPERYTALRDIITDKVRNVLRPPRRGTEQPSAVEDFWALKDVSFEVKRGEVVGIIGRNGAGKSTLLKILSRITEPTEGCAKIDGRVASMLEVGTGFHPELSGRENIYLNGAILGMSHAEIRRRFEEIVAFAEVEKFLDTPVKRYSSGMYMRLAFSVAAHLEPEILVVDEVLAVGDIEFQRKCLGKLKSVANNDKRTVLFVSHNLAAIQTLCTQAMVLRSGRILGLGDVHSQVEAYLADVGNSHHASVPRARRLSPSLTLDSLSFNPNSVESGAASTFTLQLSSSKPARLRELVLLLYAGLGARVAILDLRSARLDYLLTAGKPLKMRGVVHSLPLVEGDYSVGLWINCSDFSSDVYDLASLSIICSQAELELPPYPPHSRGFVELSYEFSIE